MSIKRDYITDKEMMDLYKNERVFAGAVAENNIELMRHILCVKGYQYSIPEAEYVICEVFKSAVLDAMSEASIAD